MAWRFTSNNEVKAETIAYLQSGANCTTLRVLKLLKNKKKSLKYCVFFIKPRIFQTTVIEIINDSIDNDIPRSTDTDIRKMKIHAWIYFNVSL